MFKFQFLDEKEIKTQFELPKADPATEPTLEILETSSIMPYPEGKLVTKLTLKTGATLHYGIEETTIDVISGQYEGGSNVWECLLDLIDYLDDDVVSNELFKGKSVLELGCGHGLAGIIALQHSARSVTFNDFNQNVLVDCTGPNLLLNFSLEEINKIVLCCGDWNGLPRLNVKYDVILSSETLYTEENCETIARLISVLLGDDGTALVSSKRYYFGTRGSVFSFCNYCSLFNLCVCKLKVIDVNDGGSIRVILSVRHSSSNSDCRDRDVVDNSLK